MNCKTSNAKATTTTPKEKTTPVSNFIPSRQNDAWATIRGFVYQVNLTIVRWLELNENEELYLELGEDIDRVARSIATQDTSERLLEQVKHRESAITLQSASAVEAVVNSYISRDLNVSGKQ